MAELEELYDYEDSDDGEGTLLDGLPEFNENLDRVLLEIVGGYASNATDAIVEENADLSGDIFVYIPDETNERAKRIAANNIFMHIMKNGAIAFLLTDAKFGNFVFDHGMKYAQEVAFFSAVTSPDGTTHSLALFKYYRVRKKIAGTRNSVLEISVYDATGGLQYWWTIVRRT